MSKQLHLIYITGLGDQNPTGQRRAIKTWRWWGVQPEFFQSNWANDESLDQKLNRLYKLIDELAKTKNVGLVAVSAGATIAIKAFADKKDKIVGVVLIAGKINQPDTIGNSYHRSNPSLLQAAHSGAKALKILNKRDRKRILSRYAIADERVYKSDSRIPGARNRIVPGIGHYITIATQITVGAPSFIHFLKRLRG